MSEPDWIPWLGGEAPDIGDKIHEVKRRDGQVLSSWNRERWDWSRKEEPSDIVAYRVTQP